MDAHNVRQAIEAPFWLGFSFALAWAVADFAFTGSCLPQALDRRCPVEHEFLRAEPSTTASACAQDERRIVCPRPFGGAQDRLFDYGFGLRQDAPLRLRPSAALRTNGEECIAAFGGGLVRAWIPSNPFALSAAVEDCEVEACVRGDLCDQDRPA